MSKNYLNQTDCIELNVVYLCFVCLCLALGSHQWEQFTMHLDNTMGKPANNNSNIVVVDDNNSTSHNPIFKVLPTSCCFISGLVVYHEKMDLKQLVLCIERNDWLQHFSLSSTFLCIKHFPNRFLSAFLKFLPRTRMNRFFWWQWSDSFSHYSSFKCICVCVRRTRPILSLACSHPISVFCIGNVKAFRI